MTTPPVSMPKERPRCRWATREPLIGYHDAEWGVPVHDDRVLFEMLVLEGAQAGLSWEIVLRKREGYRAGFAGLDPVRVAAFTQDDVERLVGDPGIVRHRGKIEAAIGNAQAFLRVQQTHGSFDAWLWRFTGGKPVVTRRQADERPAATTPLSDRISKELGRLGFRFVGSTIIYAYLQAVGVVDDHEAACFRAKSKRVRT
jgi:DNA-3-methyladenine glycosylase I